MGSVRFEPLGRAAVEWNRGRRSRRDTPYLPVHREPLSVSHIPWDLELPWVGKVRRSARAAVEWKGERRSRSDTPYPTLREQKAAEGAENHPQDRVFRPPAPHGRSLAGTTGMARRSA